MTDAERSAELARRVRAGEYVSAKAKDWLLNHLVGDSHPDTATLLFEREQWNRLYHEQGRKIVALEDGLGDLLDLAERLGQGLNPAHAATIAGRALLGRAER